MMTDSKKARKGRNNMEIIVGKTAGFCYGVKRAVEGTKSEIEKTKEPIYCLGEIVHNQQVIEMLEKEGITFIEDIKLAKGNTIIRAHGVKKEIYNEAKKNNIEIKDYTCPNVLKVHKIAEKYSKNGYYIFLCGSKEHPENIGTISYCGKKSTIIETENEVYEALKKFEQSNSEKLLVISQTTYSLEKFHNIEEIIKNKIAENIELVIENTICKATELRQKETEKIAKEVEYMIIIGGKNSSNTKKLYDIANKNCKNAICVETVQELNLEEIKRQKRIGIMAGASTPQESIIEIVNAIKM